jgi:N-acetylglutamate synthase-like GNAT family acetyltransferase
MRQGDLLPLVPQNLQRMLHPFGLEWCAFVAYSQGRAEGCPESLRDETGSTLTGFAGLRFWTPTHAEVRTLCVGVDAQGQGVGRRLLMRLEAEAALRGAKTLFALTKAPHFFARFGFEVVGKEAFPWKVSGDCFGCAKRAGCQEVAVSKELL